MATVSEVELEQKTSEYVNFVREHFVVTKREFYGSDVMQIGYDDGVLILQYKGK